MIADGLEKLKQLIEEGQAVEIITPPAEADDLYGVRIAGYDRIEWRKAAPHPRHYTVDGIDDFIDVIRRERVDESKPVPIDSGGSPTIKPTLIFSSRGSIFAYLDDDHDMRRETVTCTLPHSHAWRELADLAAQRRQMRQRDFLRFLRIELTSSVVPIEFINRVKSMKFSTGAAASANLGGGDESITTEVRRQAYAGGQPLPDEDDIVLTPRVYEQGDEAAGEEFDILCKCVVDLEPATFTLIPLPGQLEAAQRQADEQINAVIGAALGPEAVIVRGEA